MGLSQMEVFNTSMNSFNHYAYGAIGEWMYANLMGLKINENYPALSVSQLNLYLIKTLKILMKL